MIEPLIEADTKLLEAWDRETQRSSGAPLGNQNALKLEQQPEGETIVDNIHGCFSPERPTGTSEQAGLRRLRKAAEAGEVRS
jgi:hypothetical protein